MRRPVIDPDVARQGERGVRLGDVRCRRIDRRQAVVARCRAGQRRAHQRHGLADTRIRCVEGRRAVGQAHGVTPDHTRERPGLHSRRGAAVIHLVRHREVAGDPQGRDAADDAPACAVIVSCAVGEGPAVAVGSGVAVRRSVQNQTAQALA